MVEESFADIPALHPGVAEVIPVAVRRWKKSLFSRAIWQEISAFKARLSSRRYDWVIDTQGLLKSALIVGCVHAVRHGQDWGSAREPLASLFYQHSHSVARGQHAVTRNRQLAAMALGYPIPVTPPDYGIGALAPASLPWLPQRYIVGLHATSRASKLWPVDHWVALGQQLLEQGLNLVLPWGSEAEHKRALEIAASVPGAVVPPKLRLAELAAVLAGAVASVGVDTGLIHLAVALDVPAVAIYTDTDPVLTGVLGAHPERSLNLGGIGQTPSCDAVLAALQRVMPI